MELANQGLHRGSAWLQLLDPATAVPDTIPGDTPEKKLANYADYLAAQVRLSYPTAAVSQMVGAGELAVEAPNQVHDFLTTHHGKFELGVQPVEQFIARNTLDVAGRDAAQRQTAPARLSAHDIGHSDVGPPHAEGRFGVSNRPLRQGHFHSRFRGRSRRRRAGAADVRQIGAHPQRRPELTISFLTAKTGLTLGGRLS